MSKRPSSVQLLWAVGAVSVLNLGITTVSHLSLRAHVTAAEARLVALESRPPVATGELAAAVGAPLPMLLVPPATAAGAISAGPGAQPPSAPRGASPLPARFPHEVVQELWEKSPQYRDAQRCWEGPDAPEHPWVPVGITLSSGRLSVGDVPAVVRNAACFKSAVARWKAPAMEFQGTVRTERPVR